MLPSFGLLKTTLLDYPGLVAAVLFTAGCNFRCPWCQNPGLVHEPWEQNLLSEAEVLAFLEKRRKVLQGVVITGGEPLLQPRIADLVEKIRALGYQIKLDTNGSFPDRLAQVGPLVDYVAVDVKNAPSAYASSTGVSVNPALVARTLDWIRTHRPLASEVRLTWVPGLNQIADLNEYAALVGSGLPVWVQAYRPGPVLDPSFASVRGPTPEEIFAVVDRLVHLGVDARAR